MLLTKNLIVIIAIAAIVVAVVAGAVLIPAPKPEETTPVETTSPTSSPTTPSTSPTSPSPSPQPTSPTPTSTPTPMVEEEIAKFESLLEIISNVEYVEYEILSDKGEELRVRMETAEGETVEGENTWKVEVTYTTKEDKGMGTFWVSKETGEVVKLAIKTNGETYEITGAQAKSMGAPILASMITPFITYYGTVEELDLALTEEKVVSYTKGVTITTKITTVNIGGKQYKAYKVSYTVSPLSEAYEKTEVVKGELTLGELLAHKWFVVHIRTEFKDGTWAELNIVDLKLRM